MTQTLALLIPAYNASAFLPRLLKTAAEQVRSFDEIIVYDDASVDDTAAIAESYGAKVLRGDKNVGQSAGRNILTRVASSTYVHYHDADDALKPEFTTLAYEWIKIGPPDIVLFAYEYRDEITNMLFGVRTFDDAKLKGDPRRYTICEQINPFSGIYRRAAILAADGFDEDPRVRYDEDDAFHIKMSFSGLSFSADPRVAIINYRREGSFSLNQGLKCACSRLAVLKKTATRTGAQLYRQELSEALWRNATSLATHQAFNLAAEAVSLAISLHPEIPEVAGSFLFRQLARFNPYFALRLREAINRVRKSAIRAFPA